jgi:GDP-4-dehydro-6-deoxy-D-mannose reductase
VNRAVSHRILVTGARGFVGGHLLRLLAAEEPHAEIVGWQKPGTGPDPVPADRSSSDPARRATWLNFDVLDRDAVRRAVAQAAPDEVYHLAGAAHVGNSWGDTAGTLVLNVLGTHYLLDALRASGSPARVLIPGSATVYAPSDSALHEDSAIAPASPYALSKLAQEMLGASAVTSDAQPVLLVRAFNHLGPGQDPSFFAPSFAQQLAAIEAGFVPPRLRVGNLEARRDLTDVRDTVRAYRALMKHGAAGRPYNVCSGRAWSIREILDALVSRCRVRVTVETDPARLRPNDTPLVLGSPERLHAETGWVPLIAMEQTLQDVLDEARLRQQLSTPANTARPLP